jgi:SagB-type dehydrogenase family enzyme
VSESVIEYRRIPGLVCYWKDGQQYCFSHASAPHVPVTADAVQFLDLLDTWTTARGLADRFGGESLEAAEGLLESLADLTLVEKSSTPSSDEAWSCWEPEAAFFHFATRDQPYPDDLRAGKGALIAKARHTPPPAPTKRIDGPRIALARTAPLGQLEAVLKARRSWRQFAGSAIPREALGTLLDLTCRVQRWGDVPGQGRVALKTSPSAGARHPVEAYVLAWNVEGLEPGAYHYDAADGVLVDLRRPVTGEEVGRLIAHQAHYAAAGAIVALAAVFEREMWKYPFARAYRAVLIDAGHLGQTFCLVATELGLAPFCTMAFFETPLEALVGIDGRRESILYVVGVGTKPPGVANPSVIPTEPIPDPRG